MRLVVILMLTFVSLSFSLSKNDYSYELQYAQNRKSAASGGLALRLVGMGVQYGIALPMAANTNPYDKSAVFGVLLVDYAGGFTSLAGDITAGVAATRAYKSIMNDGVHYTGPNSSWGLFVAGMGIGALGGFINKVTEGEGGPVVVGTVVISDLLLTIHCIKSVQVTKGVKRSYEMKQQSVSFGVAPIITEKGAGLSFAVRF